MTFWRDNDFDGPALAPSETAEKGYVRWFPG